jgi:DNA-binding GntR family transcriptional regulator
MRRSAKKQGALKSTTVVSDLHKHLLRSIVMGEIPPGEVLSEETLAAQFGVSRTPVREVLIHLQNDGLLQKGPWRGYAVSEMSIESLKETFHIRLLLEPEAARLAAGNPVAVQFLQQAEKALEKMMELAGRQLDVEGLFYAGELDTAFHVSIADASGSKSLSKIIAMVRRQTQRFWGIAGPVGSVIDITLKEHQAVFDAIKARDSGASERLMREHVQKAVERGLRLEQGAASARELLRPSM